MRLSRDLEKNYIFVILKNLQFQLRDFLRDFFFSLSSKVTINDSSFEISRGAGGWEIRIAASARQVAVLLLQIIVLSLRITQIFAHPVNIDNLC